MIVKFDGITVEELQELFRFLKSKSNQKALLWPEGTARSGKTSPFAKIMKCEAAPCPESDECSIPHLPHFNLTLEMTELWSGKPMPLHLLVELMQALGRFPDEPVATTATGESETTNPTWHEKVLHTLEETGGNRTEAARLLGVDPRTIFRVLEEHDRASAGKPQS